MCKTFRIMPAQRMDLQKVSGVRYGFVIPDHPLGVPTASTRGWFNKGDYIASWATFAEAYAAANCLGLGGAADIRPVNCLVPDTEGSAP